jgi:hypothetical protein
MLIRLRFRFSEIFFGMLLAGAIFALGSAFWSSQSPTSPPKENAKTDDSTNQQKQKEGWLERAADPLAVITLLLVVVGAGQVVLFYRQLSIIRESLVDAKVSADAAKEAAEAVKSQAEVAKANLTSIQRPRLVVRELLMLPNSEPIEIRYVVANVGASDATIVESHIELQDVADRILWPLQPIEGDNPIGHITLKAGTHNLS